METSIKKLEGRIAVVTGAGRGLGKDIALALAQAGARIALVARNSDQLERVSTEIRKANGEAEVFPADISKEEQVSQLATAITGRWGSVHILVNNAGVNVRNKITDFTPADWRRVIDTNLVGPFLLCRVFLPFMKGHGYGRIINVTSTQSHVALPGRTAYAASKAGLLGFTRALALELAREDITVNGISPGPFATEINLPLLNNPQVREQFTSRIPVGRWGRVEEVGALALYLCSEEADFITGTDILIDGGWCAQ